ncbi:hypothetical protein yinte0001_20360 [Yersinia intermedia ATCC 29909]|nr:hypothetical protein yinte0001_20360 [Yersinia intermedia ATCC 29909]
MLLIKVLLIKSRKPVVASASTGFSLSALAHALSASANALHNINSL